MYLQFYRQKATELKEGFTYYSGEDGQPYVDDHLIIIADGLGGTGSIRHPSIAREVLDEETSMRAFFGDMYEHIDDERFVSYFKRSFKELFLLKDFYGKSPYSYKKSSYFGSRIVSSVLLYHTLFDERLNPEKLFASFSSLEESAREEFLTNLGNTVAEIIKGDIHQVAQNANIFYESKIPRLKVMATTLCATIYLEHEDYVEAFYFISGDSRPYVWTVDNGLQQIIADQESEDGGMNGCIYEGGKFSILCKYFKFNKPCVLFNASDGCFDSGKYLSPMAFEKLILEAFTQSGSIEETEQRFISDFDEYGTHDDSSTLALSSFGYSSFEELQNDCFRRLDTIKTEYLDKFEGLLDINYGSNYERSQIEFKRKITALKKEFESVDAVMAYCESKATQAAGGVIEPDPNDDPTVEERQKVECIKKDIYKLISIDLMAFVDLAENSECLANCFTIRNKALRTEILNLTERHLAEVESMILDLEESIPKLRDILSETKRIGMPTDFENYKEIGFSNARMLFHKLQRLEHFLVDMDYQRQELVRKISRRLKEYMDYNNKILEKYPDLIERIYDKLIKGDVEISAELLKTNEKEMLVDLIGQTVESLGIIAEADQLRLKNAIEKAKRAYWDANFVTVMITLAEDISFELPEELRTRVMEEKIKLDGSSAENKDKAEIQSGLFELYDIKYSEIMKGN